LNCQRVNKRSPVAIGILVEEEICFTAATSPGNTGSSEHTREIYDPISMGWKVLALVSS
jgi:hypothetical protein